MKGKKHYNDISISRWGEGREGGRGGEGGRGERGRGGEGGKGGKGKGEGEGEGVRGTNLHRLNIQAPRRQRVWLLSRFWSETGYV